MTPKSRQVAVDKFDELDPKEFIIIKGARVNNLKNLNVAIPRNQLVVITGLSGSGKSSLAFDTLFAEGQRMYVESLSSYVRQFLGRMEKPEVDYIKGVSPAIAIEQKVNTRNPRSTVGTTTEIHDYLKLLYARIGITYSPISGKRVKRQTVSDVVDFIMSNQEGEKYQVTCPLTISDDRDIVKELNVLMSKGYTRVLVDEQLFFIEDLLKEHTSNIGSVKILIDRGVVSDREDERFRVSDSVQTAFYEGHGECTIVLGSGIKEKFSDRFELDGMQFVIPAVNFFSFNNPYGACRNCEGFGKILGIDEDLVIPDKSLSVYDGAIAPWRSESMKKWLKPLVANASEFDFPIHRAIRDLDQDQIDLIWNGNKYFKGINAFFKFIESKTHKIQYRVLLSRYRGRTTCPDCKGTRLRKDASYVKIADKSITELVLEPIDKVNAFFSNLELSPHETRISARIITEITNRLGYLLKVGLSYLTLNRLTSTLSGGEYQRIKLATSIGSALVGAMYILDEPSIGLHPRDTNRLIEVLLSLRDLKNTVIVVEHEEEIMRAADQIIDIGPGAGTNGGELVFQGAIEDMNGEFSSTFTGKYLMGVDQIPIPKNRRKWSRSILLKGVRENNLKSINVEIPLNTLTVITGVSGSGKSTLIRKILYPSIGKILGTVGGTTGKFDSLDGDYSIIRQIEFVDQNPIGKSSRSNPVTYVKAYDAIRQLFADQPLAKQRGYKPAYFSFNVDGGRCEVCQGEGTVKIEMQFMADIHLTCESCKGKRFKNEIQEIKFKEKNISEVLELTVRESIDFFHGHNAIINKLLPLKDVGLGYVRLGQSSSSLSGGEAQRVKLASYLGKGKKNPSEHILFMFDEPTTGLHFQDIRNLMAAINALIDLGNSVVIIEHNIEVIKLADWIIDLGPEGGEMGGEIAFKGTPEEMIKIKNNHTANYLIKKFVH